MELRLNYYIDNRKVGDVVFVFDVRLFESATVREYVPRYLEAMTLGALAELWNSRREIEIDHNLAVCGALWREVEGKTLNDLMKGFQLSTPDPIAMDATVTRLRRVCSAIVEVNRVLKLAQTETEPIFPITDA